MLRDRLVCGVAHVKWQQRLLSEEGLTYDKALKLLLAMESAEKEAKDLSGTATGAGEVVHNVHHKRPPPGHYSQHRPQMPACYRCGGYHDPSQCLFAKEECLYCHKRGHIAAVCRHKARNSRQQQPRSTTKIYSALPAKEQETATTTPQERGTKTNTQGGGES